MIDAMDDEKETILSSPAENSLPLQLTPEMQDKLNALPVENVFQNENEVRKDIGPYETPLKKPTPTFKETFVHSMPFLRGLGDGPDLNPLSDSTPPGWNASADENNFAGLTQKNIGYVAAATSPNDAFFRRLAALDKQDEDENFENGSLAAKILGGFVDTLPFSLIPLGQTFKYADLSKTIFEAALKASPGLFVGSLLHEGSVQAHEIGGNIEDTLRDTFTDTIMGLAFVGAGAGLGKGWQGLKFWDARDILKLHYQGINAEIKIDPKGKVLGLVAVPQQGMNVGAAEVDAAQAFLNSTFARNGLFAIPKIGGLLEKTIGIANPIVRGLTSPFETVRGYADRSASHTIITEGILKGIEKPEDFETLMGIVMADNKLYSGQMKTLLDRRNDINNKSELKNLVERTRKKWQKEGYTDAEAFAKEVKRVILSDTPHQNAVVNEGAALTKQYLNDTWELLRETFNMPKDWIPPPTSEGFFPRAYNLSLMVERPQQWQDMWVGWWKEADQEINTAMKPIKDFEAEIKAAQTTHNELNETNSTLEERKKSINELKASKRKLKKMREDLADRIKSNKRMFLHGDDHAALSGKESRALKKLFKPLNKKKKELKVQKKVVEKLTTEKLFISEKVDEESLKRKVEIDKELKTEKDKLKKIQDEHDIEAEKLQEMAQENKISPRLYDRIPETNRVKFKKPGNLMKFRKTFESEYHMKEHADGLRDTILNQTPEDTMQQVLGNFIGSASTNPNSLMKRTQMIPDEILQSNDFLSNNLPLIVSNYRNALHRKISLKTVFNDVTIDGGIEPIVERLGKEFKSKEKALIANMSLKEVDKAKNLKRLNKQFQDAKEYMSLTYDRMMARTRGGRKMRKFLRYSRLWTVSTRLGSVPLTMITDLSAIIYKHEFWPTIRDGLIPALENLQHRIQTGQPGDYIENAAHAHLGLSTVLAANNDRDWGGIAMEQVPMTGALGNLMEHAAHISGNIALTNQAENQLQRLAGSVVQSKIMRYMVAFQNGTLKEKDLQKLLMYGVDPKKWSERFIKGWKASGKDGTLKGNYQSRFWEWDDVEAANKMSRTIFKGVKDTIISRGMMDSPFFFDDPVWGTIVFFHGWSTAALTRYLVPLMQRPDAEHLTGATWMLAAGSLVTPLRKITKGESPFDEESNMFKDAFTDSGVFTPIMSLIENANIMTNGRILNGISNDKYKGRSIAAALGGPVVGVGDDVTHILGMFLSGKLNETDVKKAGRLLPAMQPWYLKGLQNKAIEGLGLPKNAHQANANAGNVYR